MAEGLFRRISAYAFSVRRTFCGENPTSLIRLDCGAYFDGLAYHCAAVHTTRLVLLLVQAGATGWERFAVFSAVAFVVFVSVLRLALHNRALPNWPKILVTGAFIVFGGMLFARRTYAPGLPWWIFYGLPALATFLVPPAMFRMSRTETASYIAMAILMAPAIHVFFSFFIRWHDYMPWFYVPSVWELMHGSPSH
jgi:hypothetical protein